MSNISKTLLMTTLLASAATAFAQEQTSNTPSGYQGSSYWSAGMAKMNVDPFMIEGQPIEIKDGFLLGGGATKPLPFKNTFWEWSILIGGSETSYTSKNSSGYCSTTNNQVVECGESLTTVIGAIPLTANAYYDITPDLQISAGAGASLAMLYYSSGLNADEYQSKQTSSASATTLSPIIQAALTYQKLQLKVMQLSTLGNDKTGKGDSTFITLNWVNRY
jgi:hypothetical protein